MVVAAEDAETFIAAAARENLEATIVAVVTEEPRMVMRWNGKIIVRPLPRLPELQRRGQARRRARAGTGHAVAARSCRRARLRRRLDPAVSDLNACRQGLVRAVRLHHRRGLRC